ncbi:MAG: tetratricopeptide repeat protein [bacterium]|nr:tetratricopeptide repeat protein [bacterium]
MLKKKAENGDPEAQYMLGNAYYDGCMLKRNNSEAVKWYRRAAEQGDPDAPIMLAISYENGFGVPRDELQAYMWYSVATSRRVEDTYKNYIEWRDDAGRKLTPEQLEKAQKMTREWEAKHPKK